MLLFEYLKIGKEDSLDHFRFIGANFLEKNSHSVEACELLVDISDLSKFSMEQRLGIASILLKYDKVSEGLEIAYHARLDYYNYAKSHEQYLSCVLQKSEEPKEIMFPRTVKVDTGIYLQDRTNVESLFFITDDERVSGTNILRSSDKLAAQFIGKQVNDTIEMQNSIGPGNVLTVTSIINKNVYAFRESLKLLETRFMGESSMIFGSVAPSNDGKGGLLEFIKDHLTKVKHQKEELYRLYESDSATIGMLSSFSRTNIIETWLEMIGSEKTIIKSYIKDETKELNSVISEGRPVVIDIISLLTNFYLFQGFQVLDSLDIKYIVAKSTVEELVSYKEFLKERGPVTSIVLDGELKKSNFTQNDVDAYVRVIDIIINWCKKNTIIHSPSKAYKLTKELQRIKDILGRSFYDTLIVAKEHNALMLSDDERLKQVAFGEHNVQSFSSYQCIVYLLLLKRLPEANFIEFVKILIRSNYGYIPISGKILWELSYESDFTNIKTLQQATRGLIIMSPDFCAQAISKFSRYVLLNEDINPESNSLISFVIGKMEEHPQVEQVRAALMKIVEKDFNLLPGMKKHMIKLLRVT
ncbi:hypothetical protein WG906_03070 [Pedobacter sp. P351]|uniref:PIN domain-containing protein n=1 Tax=Pedobacter superstes TaxID=3133441 RepID=UPI0030B7E67D